MTEPQNADRTAESGEQETEAQRLQREAAERGDQNEGATRPPAGNGL